MNDNQISLQIYATDKDLRVTIYNLVKFHEPTNFFLRKYKPWIY